MAAGPPPIAIRKALEDGWAAFWQAPRTLVLFTLLLGCLNLGCQLLIRWSREALAADPLSLPEPPALLTALHLLAWLGYWLSNIWLMVGLLQGSELAVERRRPQLRQLLRIDGASLVRAGGTVGLVVLLLALIVWLAQASSWLAALLNPPLAALPLLAGLAALVYLVTDQVLSLPIAVLGGFNPLQAVRRGRAAIDPHWPQALGLTLLLGLLVLAGFLLLLVGLAATLPLAACTLVAAYRQIFAPVNLGAGRTGPRPWHAPQELNGRGTPAGPETDWRDSSG